jgi:hypothetical protein
LTRATLPDASRIACLPRESFRGSALAPLSGGCNIVLPIPVDLEATNWLINSRTNANDQLRRGRGRGRPRASESAAVGRRARIALIFSIMVAALGWGTAIAAAYEALEDMQARGEMDPTW